MAEKIVSPGVFTNEIDASFLPPAIAEIGACVIGPTVKGPALIPTQVSSYSDYVAKFGDSFKSGSKYYQYLTSHTAEQYLKHNDKLTVVRVLAGSYSGASATISSSVDPGVLGGGIGATGSIQLVGGAATTGNAGLLSMSFTPTDGTEVKLVFTGSADIDTSLNTSTLIYVDSGSGGLAGMADSASAAINNSGSLHSLPLVASFGGPAGEIGFTSSYAGELGNGDANVRALVGDGFGGLPSGVTPLRQPGYSQPQNKYVEIKGQAALFTSKSISGGREILNQLGNSSILREVFKLHTLADGKIMNSGESGSIENALDIGTNQILPNGNKSNIRYEIAKVNHRRGTFSLSIRRGDDTLKRTTTLESYSDINLDPNSTSYIGKIIGDQVETVGTDENGKPFIQLTGDHARKSKYVRVEILEKTPDYILANGEVGFNPGTGLSYSASLPSFGSGSNSGSFGGSFTGGSDGTVTHPIAFYEDIDTDTSQGLDPSDDGAAAGFNDYELALNLISNQDDYDVNLILVPGIISSLHSKLAVKVMDVCEDRGDCFAILDPVKYDKNVVDAVTEGQARDSNYAAMYWPWLKIQDSAIGGTFRWVPPSVAVSGVYAFNDKVAHEWFAPAGLNRGTMEMVRQAERKLTQADRDSLYNASINPIATFPASGVTIFGQKTLQKKASALDRVNVRRLLIKVKKFIASSSRFLVFEQNTAALRRRFLAMANPFMEQVQSQSGLNAFRIVMDESNNTPDTIDRNQLIGQIFVQPTRTAEFIVLDFVVQRTGAAFPE